MSVGSPHPTPCALADVEIGFALAWNAVPEPLASTIRGLTRRQRAGLCCAYVRAHGPTLPEPDLQPWHALAWFQRRLLGALQPYHDDRTGAQRGSAARIYFGRRLTLPAVKKAQE